MSHIFARKTSKLFDDSHSNDECHNDKDIRLFDVQHLNDKCHNDLNIKPQTV